MSTTAVPQDQLSQDLASLKIDRSAKPSGRRRSVLLVAVLVTGGLGAAGYYMVYPYVQSVLFTRAVKTGDIVLVSPSQARVQLTATGYVVAQTSAKIATKVPGRIAELFVVEGQVIEKGAKIARLEDVDFKTTLATSRARATAARARVQISRSNLVELRVTLDRDKPLAEKGVIPKAPVDDLEAKVGSLTASIHAAEAEAAAADAETHSLAVQLDSYLITSPISGTVVAKLIEVGESVSPVFGTPGVVEIVDLTSLVVEVDVPEARLSQIVPGGPAEIVLDAYPDKRFRGVVKEIGRRINRAKATVPVKVRLVDRPAEVLPEMAARVSFLSEALDEKAAQAPPVLVVPAAAIVQRAGRDVVFVYDDEHVRMVTVKAGKPFADGRELETQIPAGTKVVLDPPADLGDGQKVKEENP
jgi:RND family efflux transporter MFP subunit